MNHLSLYGSDTLFEENGVSLFHHHWLIEFRFFEKSPLILIPSLHAVMISERIGGNKKHCIQDVLSL
jgi:hypothetical protein